jgi:branched-chain amino acid aminotransferase
LTLGNGSGAGDTSGRSRPPIGFGRQFTPHMFSMDWTVDDGWHHGRVGPRAPLSLDPAAAVLHYAQAIFEGLKAYRFPDGSAHIFRPDMNARRLQASAARLCLPEVPVASFVDSVRRLVVKDMDWVPAAPASLYLRPFLVATEAFLGVREAEAAQYHVIGSPAGDYFPGGAAGVDIWLSRRYSRAGRGGTGAAKTGGNYASSLAAQKEARTHGCDQVLFLDASEGRFIEELGGMNLVLVRADGSLLTPASESILAGVTVDSILELAKGRGHTVEQRPIELDEWVRGAADGTIVAAFACGTAAVVTPISVLRGDDVAVRHKKHPLAALPMSLRTELLEIQHGMREDTHRWMVPALAAPAEDAHRNRAETSV